jgi:hypothetical protein
MELLILKMSSMRTNMTLRKSSTTYMVPQLRKWMMKLTWKEVLIFTKKMMNLRFKNIHTLKLIRVN